MVGMIVLLAPDLARAQEDLPGRVGRIADLAGELFIAPPDRPDQWAAIGLNYPVTSGDNLWAGTDGRAEVDYGGGQFRLAGDTNLHVSQLDDRQLALFLAEGRLIVRIRVLDPGDSAALDTPNAQLVFTRPGLYRVEVTPDRQRTMLAVREGEVNILTAGATQQVLPGQSAIVEGAEARFAEVRNGLGYDGFDTWSANRDRRYARSRTASYVSRQMVGYADLDEYGTWSQAPEYGAVWYPSDVGPDWAPYRNGYWVDVGTWGPTWVDYAPWGYAPFHYGRWAYIGGRWGWCPGAYVARPYWAPAMVGWAGGPGWGLSVTAGAPVYGWVPLAWGEPYRPWWGHCSNGCWDRYNRPYAVNVAERHRAPPTRYVNWSAPGGISAVSSATFVARKPVQANLVRVPVGMVATAPVLNGAPIVRADPARSPDRRPVGAPPPASTFYPTTARSRDRGPTGAVTLPGGTQAVAVPPGARSRNATESPAKPLQVAPSGQSNPPTGMGYGTTRTPQREAMRQAPQAVPPAGAGAATQSVTVPPARADLRRDNRQAPSTLVAPMPQSTYAQPSAQGLGRPVTRPAPVAPPPPAAASPGLAAPAAPVRQAPQGAQLVRQAPAAPMAASPGLAAPAAPVRQAPQGAQGVRQSPAVPMAAPPAAAPPGAPVGAAAPVGGDKVLVRER